MDEIDYSVIVGETVTVLFIIMAWSYLIKDNILFKFVQATYVGLGVGHWLVMVVKYFRENTFPTISSTNPLLILPFAIGLLLFGRLKREYLWVYKYPLAILVGAGLGLQIRGMLKAELIDQLISTMNISLTPSLEGFNSVIIFIFVISAMFYFFFTVRDREVTTSGTINLRGIMTKIGQYVLMGAFGAGFAASFLGRLAVLMDVLENVVFFIPKMLGL